MLHGAHSVLSYDWSNYYINWMKICQFVCSRLRAQIDILETIWITTIFCQQERFNQRISKWFCYQNPTRVSHFATKSGPYYLWSSCVFRRRWASLSGQVFTFLLCLFFDLSKFSVSNDSFLLYISNGNKEIFSKMF